MKVRNDLTRPVCRVGAVAVSAALAISGIALASDAVKGATYSGHYAGRPADLISFEVSANGKQIIDLSADTPFKCNGGCGGVENASGGSATIKKNGKFSVTVKLSLPGSSTIYGTDTVTGTFLSHGRAKGTVTSHFNGGSGGETVNWTATG
jgi:hypothetical protein